MRSRRQEWKQKHMMKLNNMVETREAPRSMREGVLDHVLDHVLDQELDQELIESEDVEKFRNNLELAVDNDTKVYMTPLKWVVEICETESDILKENSELIVISYTAEKVRGPEMRKMSNMDRRHISSYE